jgi:AraC-like DNA-binding protein
VARRAIDFLDRSHPWRPVHVGELYAKFSTLRRTLFRIFNDSIGVSPIAYLRRKRLCAVHTRLCGGDFPTISFVAIDNGFAQLSRFARQYRAMFGELPSQTVQRRFLTIAPKRSA